VTVVALTSCHQPSEPVVSATTSPSTGFVSLGLSGYSVYSVRESKNYLYACTGKDGLLRIKKSTIGKAHWEYLGLKDNHSGTYGVMDVAVFGESDSIIVAGIMNSDTLHCGIKVSYDQGLSWICSDSNITSNDIVFGDRVRSIGYFARDYSTNGVLFSVSDDNSAVFWSHDSGIHWARTNNTSLTFSFMDWVEIEPKRPDHVWAGGRLQRSTNGGNDWRFLNNYSDIFPDSVMWAISFGNIGEIYICQTSRIVYSNDDGQAFKLFCLPDSAVRFSSVLVDPENASRVFVQGHLYSVDAKHNINFKQTRIYEYFDGHLSKVDTLKDALPLMHLRVIQGTRLIVCTDGNGLFELSSSSNY